MGIYRTVRRVVAAVACVSLLCLTGCAGLFPENSPRAGAGIEVTVGAPDAPEGRLLAELYGQVLAWNGYDVSYNFGPGDRAEYIATLQAGHIDFIPDYSGDVLSALYPQSTDRSAFDVAVAAREELALIGLDSLTASPAENGLSLVVTREFAEEHQLDSIADLAPIAADITIGAAGMFETVDPGRALLMKTYAVEGWRLEVIPHGDPTLSVDALLADRVQVAVLSAASPLIIPNNLVVLKDPNNVLTASSLIPIIVSRLNTHTFVSIVDSVSTELTTEDLRDLFTRQQNDRAPSDDRIAREWLTSHHLLG